MRPLNTNVNFDSSIVVKGHPEVPKSREPDAQVRAATSGYFRAYGIRLVAGRLFNDEDTAAAPVALVVNQRFVKTVFPNENPLGQQVEIADNGQRAAETARWVGRWRGGIEVRGVYMAAWRQDRGQWLLERELYVTLQH